MSSPFQTALIALKAPVKSALVGVATATVQAVAQAHNNPFRALAPYEERDGEAHTFYGRDAETAELAAQITTSRVFVLYGRSGIGKTSIVRAGLVRALRERSFDPVYARLLGDPATELVRVVAAVFGVRGEQLTDVLRARRIALEEAERKKLSEQGRKDGRVHAAPPVLLLDQFEEVFLRAVDRSDGDRLAQQIAAALAAPDLDVRVVFSLRDEHLASLDDFQDALQRHLDKIASRPAAPGVAQEASIALDRDLLDHRRRLRGLTAFGTREAFTRTLYGADVDFDEALLDALLVDLQREAFDPLLLQIVCTETFEHAKDKAHLTLDDYRATSGVAGIFERYLTRAIEGRGEDPILRVVLATLCRERHKRALTLDQIRGEAPIAAEAGDARSPSVSGDPTRVPFRVAREEIAPVLDHLVRAGLVARHEPRSGDVLWEVVHDRAVERARTWLAADSLHRQMQLAADLVARVAESGVWRAQSSALLSAGHIDGVIAPFRDLLALSLDQRALLTTSALHAGSNQASFWIRRLGFDRTADLCSGLLDAADAPLRAAAALGLAILGATSTAAEEAAPSSDASPGSTTSGSPPPDATGAMTPEEVARQVLFGEDVRPGEANERPSGDSDASTASERSPGASETSEQRSREASETSEQRSRVVSETTRLQSEPRPGASEIAKASELRPGLPVHSSNSAPGLPYPPSKAPPSKSAPRTATLQGVVGSLSATPLLRIALGDPRAEVRRAAARAFLELAGPKDIGALIEAFRSGGGQGTAEAILARSSAEAILVEAIDRDDVREKLGYFERRRVLRAREEAGVVRDVAVVSARRRAATMTGLRTAGAFFPVALLLAFRASWTDPVSEWQTRFIAGTIFGMLGVGGAVGAARWSVAAILREEYRMNGAVKWGRALWGRGITAWLLFLGFAWTVAAGIVGVDGIPDEVLVVSLFVGPFLLVLLVAASVVLTQGSLRSYSIPAVTRFLPVASALGAPALIPAGMALFYIGREGGGHVWPFAITWITGAAMTSLSVCVAVAVHAASGFGPRAAAGHAASGLGPRASAAGESLDPDREPPGSRRLPVARLQSAVAALSFLLTSVLFVVSSGRDAFLLARPLPLPERGTATLPLLAPPASPWRRIKNNTGALRVVRVVGKTEWTDMSSVCAGACDSNRGLFPGDYSYVGKPATHWLVPPGVHVVSLQAPRMGGGEIPETVTLEVQEPTMAPPCLGSADIADVSLQRVVLQGGFLVVPLCMVKPVEWSRELRFKPEDLGGPYTVGAVLTRRGQMRVAAIQNGDPAAYGRSAQEPGSSALQLWSSSGGIVASTAVVVFQPHQSVPVKLSTEQDIESVALVITDAPALPAPPATR